MTSANTQGMSNLQNSTGTEGNSNSLQVDRGNVERIEDTVFGIANNDQGWFLTIGKNAITKPVETRKGCIGQLGELQPVQWDIIFKMVILVAEHLIDEEIKNKIGREIEEEIRNREI